MNLVNLIILFSVVFELILLMDMGLIGGVDFLSFMFGIEFYGVILFYVEEICVWEKFMLILRVLYFVKGVINLCGMIVFIIDLC